MTLLAEYAYQNFGVGLMVIYSVNRFPIPDYFIGLNPGNLINEL
jgi:hypothetical protein